MNMQTPHSSPSIDLRTPTPKHQELLSAVVEGAGHDGVRLEQTNPHAQRQAFEGLGEIVGIPKPGTPEFREMQAKLWAERTPEEAAEFDAEQVNTLEQQFDQPDDQ